jgi:hypothetical protein
MVRRLASFALMTAIVLSHAAQCLIGQEMTMAQMACCAGTDHDCEGTEAFQADCCPSERAEQVQLAQYLQQVVAPLAVLTSATAAFLRPPVTRAAFHVTATPLNAAPPPKYVLLATFLI